MLRHILFDLYGTLVHITTDEHAPQTSAAFERWIEGRFGRSAAERERARPFAWDLRDIQPGPGAHAEPDLAPVVQAHLRKVAGREPSPVEIREAAEAFRAASRRELSRVPGALEALRALRQKFGIGLVSNAQLLFTLPELRQVGLPTELFDPLVISSQAGVRKPSPRIFEQALERARAAPSEVLYVGNDPKDDVDGAAAVGLRTCRVDDPRQQGEGAHRPDLRLRSVAELAAAILGEAAPPWARSA